MGAISLLSSSKTFTGIKSGPKVLWDFKLAKKMLTSRNINLGHRRKGAGFFVWHGSSAFLSEHRTELFV